MGNEKEPSDKLSSWFGNVKVAKVGESWPIYEGVPMVPICQLNIKELPYIPKTLKNISFLTYFFRADGFQHGNLNGQGWVLHAYSDSDQLIPIEAPSSFPVHSEWGPLKQYSIKYEIGYEVTEDEDEDNEICSKIGGTMTELQGEAYFTENQLFPEDSLILDSKTFLKSDYFDVKPKEESSIAMGDFWKARGWGNSPMNEKEVKSHFVFQLDSEILYEKTGWYAFNTQGIAYFFQGTGKAADLWYGDIQVL